VDAVEIDPAIAHLGQVAHPEQPYSDPELMFLWMMPARISTKQTASTI